MSASSETDYQFVLCCLKHSQGKPDFHAVAEELGLKSHMRAYHRHWSIMKKAGMAGNTGKGRKPSKDAVAIKGAGSPGQKRGRPTKTAHKKEEKEFEEEEDEECEVKPEPEDESEEVVESAAKEIKVAGDADPEVIEEDMA